MNCVSDVGMEMLANSLKVMTILISLELNFRYFYEYFVHLSNIIIYHFLSKSISSGYNNVGDKGIELLANSLKVMTKLSSLTLKF
jgi:hypothetical protein